MKVLAQWTLKNPGNWVAVDLGADSRAWDLLPKLTEPKAGQTGDNNTRPGYISAVNVQGVVFEGYDHYHVAPLPGDGIRVTVWQDDPTDWPTDGFWAHVYDFYPLAPDPGMGGAINTRQSRVTYGGTASPYPNERPWAEFVKPTSNVIHGIWVAAALDAQHTAARSAKGWRDPEWTDHLAASELNPDGTLKDQRAQGRYLPNTHTQTYYCSDTTVSSSALTATQDLLATTSYTGVQARPAEQVLASATEEVLSWATPSGGFLPATYWPYGTGNNYRLQVSVQGTSADFATVNYKVWRLDSTLATSKASIVSTTSLPSLATTGLKLFTLEGTSALNASNATYLDRAAFSFSLQQNNTMKAGTLTLNTCEADEFVDGPWSTQAGISTLVDAFSTLDTTTTWQAVVAANYTDVTLNSGKVRLATTATGHTQTAALWSRSYFSLVGSTLYFQIPTPSSQTGQPLTVGLYSTLGGTRLLAIQYTTVGGWNWIHSNPSTGTSNFTAFTPGTNRWFRIRESGGTIYFDHAASADGTWTNAGSVTLANQGANIDYLQFRATYGGQNVAYTSYAEIDNVNYTPTGPATVTGTASGTMALTSTASGRGTALGGGTASMALATSQATGIRAQLSAATGAMVLTSTVAGARSQFSAASGVASLTSTVAGARSVAGDATGGMSLATQAATGLRVQLSAASGGASLTSSASGFLVQSSAATGSGGFTSTTSAYSTVPGAVTGSAGLTTSACSGTRGVLSAATGALALTSSVSGLGTARGAATGGASLAAGAASGTRIQLSGAMGNSAVGGSATGLVQAPGAEAMGFSTTHFQASGFQVSLASSTLSSALFGTGAGVRLTHGTGLALASLVGMGTGSRSSMAGASGQTTLTFQARAFAEALADAWGAAATQGLAEFRAERLPGRVELGIGADVVILGVMATNATLALGASYQATMAMEPAWAAAFGIETAGIEMNLEVAQ